MQSTWPDVLRQYVKDNCHRMYDTEIAARLTLLLRRPVKEEEVKRARAQLGIRKVQGPANLVRKADRGVDDPTDNTVEDTSE